MSATDRDERGRLLSGLTPRAWAYLSEVDREAWRQEAERVEQ